MWPIAHSCGVNQKLVRGRGGGMMNEVLSGGGGMMYGVKYM